MFARLKSWFRASSQRAAFEREMQDEMRVHLELYQAELRRQGVAEAEARRQAAAANARPVPKELQGPKGPEPTRYGDWENKGIASDF